MAYRIPYSAIVFEYNSYKIVSCPGEVHELMLAAFPDRNKILTAVQKANEASKEFNRKGFL